MDKLFKCSCGTLSHIVEFDKDSINPEGLDITVILNPNYSFIGRLKACFNYLLNVKSATDTWHYDGVCLTKEQKQDLINFLKE